MYKQPIVMMKWDGEGKGHRARGGGGWPLQFLIKMHLFSYIYIFYRKILYKPYLTHCILSDPSILRNDATCLIKESFYLQRIIHNSEMCNLFLKLHVCNYSKTRLVHTRI